LGLGFVATFYETLLRSPLGFGFVAQQDGRTVGFSTGVVDWRRFYRGFLRRHIWLTMRIVMANVRGGRWWRLLETARYAGATALPAAELVSIALEPEARGTGCGDMLVRHILKEFADRQVHAVRVTAGEGNVPAHRLYERAGFRLRAQMEIHPGEHAAVYVITLEPA